MFDDTEEAKFFFSYEIVLNIPSKLNNEIGEAETICLEIGIKIIWKRARKAGQFSSQVNVLYLF